MRRVTHKLVIWTTIAETISVSATLFYHDTWRALLCVIRVLHLLTLLFCARSTSTRLLYITKDNSTTFFDVFMCT